MTRQCYLPCTPTSTMRLQRLNMDNSWLLELGEKRLLIDPWLEGVEVDYFSWFNTQWHRTPPLPYDEIPHFDGVLITQKYPDHFHPVTLQRLQPTRVFAPQSLHKALQKHLPHAETTVFHTESLQSQWGGLQITWLPTRRTLDPIYDAVLLDDGSQSVVFAPHSIALDEEHLAVIEAASPCKVLISPFNHYQLPRWLGGTVAPGLAGLEQLVNALQPEHVVQTHDEDKHAKGLVHKLARVVRFRESVLPQHPWLQDRYAPVPDYQVVLW